jgi:hypothetical protein
MDWGSSINHEKQPIVVGGMGGSGTRLVAQLLMHAGVFMGSNRNYAEDALDFAPFYGSYLGGNVGLVRMFQACVMQHRAEIPDPGMRWGWKNPRSYLALEFIHRQFPDMRFVHVIRDGRDMAYAETRNMQTYWSAEESGEPIGPERAMTVWATTNMSAADYGESRMTGYTRIRFENLCHKPQDAIEGLYERLGLHDVDMDSAVNLVNPPQTMGRWKQHDANTVIEIGREALQRFGYA